MHKIKLSEPIEVSENQLPKPLSTDCNLQNNGFETLFPNQGKNVKPKGFYHGIEQQGNQWMEHACRIAHQSVKTGGGPFGAVIVQVDNKTGKILRYWETSNHVTEANDPTAHAEVMAIRSACASLGIFNLGHIVKSGSKLEQPGDISHCEIYSSCEPCPMCYSAIAWARIPKLYFAATRFDAAAPGVEFSDEEIYNELKLPYSERKIVVKQCTVPNSLNAFNLWKNTPHTEY